MEKRDLELIAQHSMSDMALKSLYDEHLQLEKKLEKFDRKPFLSPREDVERKRLQKLKLLGRDKMERILSKYR